MKKSIILALLSISTLFASDVEVESPYVRATPPNLPNSAAFMSVKNDSNKKVSIVKATSNVSKFVELHTHDMKDGVMKMYQVSKIDIPAKGKIELKPGGFHIMFIELNNPLKEGANVVFNLEFSNGEIKQIRAPIKKVISGMNHHHKHMHHKH